MKMAPYLSLIAMSVGCLLTVQNSSKDRYGDFYAYCDPFLGGRYAPLQWDELPEKGNDVSSCLFKKRAELIAILKRASHPEPFTNGNARFDLTYKGDRWIVDKDGVVRHKGKDLALRDKDFEAFRSLLTTWLPVNDPSCDRPPFKRRLQLP